MSNFLHYNKFQQSIQISINNHRNFKFFCAYCLFLQEYHLFIFEVQKKQYHH